MSFIYFSAPDGRTMTINFFNVTQSSVDLQWAPPKTKNGIIRYYRITYYMEKNDDEYDDIEDSTDLYPEQQQIKYTVTIRDIKVIHYIRKIRCIFKD